jgi:hypothetical protein
MRSFESTRALLCEVCAARMAAGGGMPAFLGTDFDGGCDGVSSPCPEASTSCPAAVEPPWTDAGSTHGSCRRAAQPGLRGQRGRGGAPPQAAVGSAQGAAEEGVAVRGRTRVHGRRVRESADGRGADATG